MRVDVDPEPADTNMGVTETGRPRRAAAPTQFLNAGKQNGTDGEGQVAAAGGRKTASALNGEDKAKRGKAKEKLPRKTRATVGARSGPRAKGGKGLAPPEPEDPGWAGKRESAPPEDREMVQQVQYLSQYAPQQPPPLQAMLGSPQGPFIATRPDAAPPADQRPRSTSQSQRPGTSSYWSVYEEQTFKVCLTWYGKDFAAIATHMGKKTTTMVSLPKKRSSADRRRLRTIMPSSSRTVPSTRS
jgi:hypothetical protein